LSVFELICGRFLGSDNGLVDDLRQALRVLFSLVCAGFTPSD
jgi:hypothetical protein